MRFTDAHSPSAVCTPTRYGLLTGRYCWRTELKKGVIWPWAPPLIEADRLTVPKLLKKHGYHTACIGKWHLGMDWPTTDGVPAEIDGPGENVDFTRPILNGPLTRGFDTYFGTAVPNFPPYCFIENDRTAGIPTEMKPNTMFGHDGPMLKGWKLEEILPALGDRAEAYITERAKTPDTPFFLYMPLTAPHTPIVPVEPYLGKSDAGLYGDFVHQVDATVGQVLRALDEYDFADNTLVIFTSDNGSPARNGTNASGPTRSVVKEFGHDPSHPLRGMKADIYEGGHRVPFIARWPERITAKCTSKALICHVDLMATCAELLDETLPNDAGEDSYSMVPLLLNRPATCPVRDTVVHHSGNGAFAIRRDEWKLVTQLGSGGWTKPSRPKPEKNGPKGQLYNMQTDLTEQTNLWLDHPDIVEDLTALLDTYKTDGRSAPLPR
jgi:arylsulfatase A-like enzyme